MPSFWLLAFSMFIFLCLGIVKRYAELYDARQAGKLGGHGRGYSSQDLEMLMPMGQAAGFSAVVVVALYINSPESRALYRHEEPMWLVCPLLLYWIMRMWLAGGTWPDDRRPRGIRSTRPNKSCHSRVGRILVLAAI